MKKLYSVKDDVRGFFNPPFVDDNDASASRTFIESAKNAPYRKDFTLYALGTWDEDTGDIVSSVSFVCHFVEPSKEVN